MSIAALHWVWNESSAETPAEVAVLAAMADWADAYGYCYPSYPAMAARARVSERQAKRVVARFVGLGELAKVTRGHRVSAPGHRPGRTGLQPRNEYRFTALPDEAGTVPSRVTTSRVPADRSRATVSPLPIGEAVTPDPGSSDTGGAEVVTPAASHIRKNRQIEPSEEPSGRDARALRAVPPTPDRTSDAAALEAFVDAWNAAARPAGLPVCAWPLSRSRRRLVRTCLTHRPLAQWREVFARVAASDYLAGRTDRRSPTALDWFLNDDGTRAARVLEGQFDNHGRRPVVGGPRPPVARCMGDHDPPCQTRTACIEKTIAEGRAQRAAASA